MAKKVTAEEFETLEKSDKLILVDFFATWCGPCQMMMPFIEELEKDFEQNKKIEIVKIDIDETPQVAAKFSVMSVPTFLFVKNGKEVDRIIGATAKDILTEKIENIFKK